MQHLLTSGPLLDESGNLAEAGYAFSLVKEYQRDKIKANRLRIKEWDYYYFGNKEYGVALTIADNSYMSMASISFLDFKNSKQITKSPMGFYSNGKLKLPPTSVTGDVFFKSKKFSMSFYNDNGKRHLVCSMKEFDGKDEFKCDLVVNSHNTDSMVIATPFKKDKHFYYNQKINDLEANGTISIGKNEYQVSSWYGVLDWGRGVWTYKNTWYWSSLSGMSDGHLIGFNLGYGFGDTSSASENMFFMDGKGYKLEDVEFKISKDSDGKEKYMEKWEVASSSGEIKLVFSPVFDRYASTSAAVIATLQNQVFGIYNGYVMINGNKVLVENVMGFAEKVLNKW